MKKIHVVIIFVLGLIGGMVLDNIIVPAMADIAGIDYQGLKSDKDFRRAVEYIIEDCRIREGKIRC